MDVFRFDAVGGDGLLFFGRIHPDKGAKEAIGVARAGGRPLDLYGIVQDQGYYEREILPSIDDVTIRYHGAVGGQARIRALGSAHALLHLINFDEPFGLSVIEAMASGTPVIATHRGSMPELIEHGVNGFLVRNPSEALEALDRVNEIDRAVVRKTVADRFSIERMADSYVDLYRRILNN
jgi:glycosyltransferase involved in cell wall biosynthesis